MPTLPPQFLNGVQVDHRTLRAVAGTIAFHNFLESIDISEGVEVTERGGVHQISHPKGRGALSTALSMTVTPEGWLNGIFPFLPTNWSDFVFPELYVQYSLRGRVAGMWKLGEFGIVSVQMTSSRTGQGPMYQLGCTYRTGLQAGADGIFKSIVAIDLDIGA